MDWINIKDKQLPKDKVFIALWKGTFCIAEYDEEDDHFYICYLPAQMSGIMRVDKEREIKFTHWAELEYPKDY